MEKTYVTYTETGCELANRNGSETFALYTGIKVIDGGWMLETGGDPATLSSLEEADATDLIASINAIIASPSTPWEALNDQDMEYISDTLAAWGD